MSYAARSAAAHASAVGGNYTNTPYSNNVPPNHSNPVHGNYQNTNVPNNSIYGHPSPQQGQGQSQQQVHQQQRLSQPQVHPQVTPAVNYSSASSVATMSTLGNASVTAGMRSPHQPQLQPNNQQPPSPYQQQQHNTVNVNVNPVQQYQNTMPYSNNTSLSASQFNTQTIEKEQTRLVAAATSRINQASFQLKRVMDDDSLLSDPPTQTQVSSLLGQVLDFAVNILIELTSFDLTPKHYYEIHMMVVNEACLAPLTEFFVDLGGYDASRITSVSELYRIVQYCPKVLPRLYLQIAAGVAMIKNGFCEGDEQRDLWDELLDAVKCVQQPVRGLFLRSYLLQVTREYLPPKLSAPLPPVSTEATVSGAVSSIGAPNSGVEDSYQFVLRNFGEMTRLWVRIQHMAGPQSTREQKKRKEKERNHVRILVGTNLVRLSQLDGLTVEDYGSVILPRIIAVMLSCRDTLAQAYLMDCTIQVFPDEFHVETLETFLEAIPRMREKVNVRTILSAMMDRLAIYGTPPLAGAGANHPDDVLSTVDNTAVNGGGSSDGFTSLFRIDAFSKFEACISAIHASREKTGKGGNVNGGMPLKETIRLHSCLLKFAKTCYPHDLGLVNRCLGGCADALAVRKAAATDQGMDEDSVRELETLLQIPQSNGSTDSHTPDLANPLGVLELDRYPDLLSQLPWENRRVVATNLLQAVSDSAIDTVQTVERLYSVITPLLRDAPTPTNIQVFPDEFHVETLETFLEAIPRMREKVNVRTILSAMMDRLAIYGTPPLVGAGASHPDDVLSVAGDNTAVNGGNSSDGFTSLFRIDAFSKFEACISAIHASREKTGKGVHGGMPLKETIRLHSCLLKFAKTCYPHDLGLVNRCLGGCADALAVRKAAATDQGMDEDSVRELETLLQIPQSNGSTDSHTPDLA
eukprot:CAMPEP_0194398484 /NCGR_PEP_ID=MMETSP0174-20130528/126127_1 /TAXON_ID=216777 /ORGANISM="Proboscia alata, Strain PI-D3" /LENGTH=916 /DNA_ID=CAMNT_0039194781 /DNA_START=145 /DNA_END=2891 /DNA_ORIENTATION=+